MKGLVAPLLGTLGLSAALAVRPAAPASARVERRLGMMGTTLGLVVEAADRAAALAASERAVAALEAAETRLSTWEERGELARLNRVPAGERVALSPELGAELAAARACWRETGGAFDPAIGRLAAAWGLRSGGRVPTEAERRAAVAAGGMEGLALFSAAGGASSGAPAFAVRRRDGVVLDEGGFGKGAGLAAALAALATAPGVRGAALDLGGQLAFLGDERHEVVVADPRRRDRPALALAVEGGSVSSSGNGERGLTVGGRRVGHLLDPRRGEPAPDFGSLTVWTADPLRADCLSTGLYVLGPEAAAAWASARGGVEAVALVVGSGALRAVASPGLAGRLRPLAEEVTIEIWTRRGSAAAVSGRSSRERDQPRTVSGGCEPDPPTAP